jgi:hypothetical protein
MSTQHAASSRKPIAFVFPKHRLSQSTANAVLFCLDSHSGTLYKQTNTHEQLATIKRGNRMNPFQAITVLAAALITSQTQADHVLIVSAGSDPTDNAMVDALSNQAHTAEIGPNYWEFDSAFE